MNLEKVLINDLLPHTKQERKRIFPKFMQTFPGGYGEGDICMGVPVPVIRKTIKKYKDTPLKYIEDTLHSKYHEIRLACALLLVEIYQKSNTPNQKIITELYLDNKDYINNWDIVDASSYKILGHYYCTNNLSLLQHVKSDHFWEKRMGIVGHYYFIKNNCLENIYEVAQYIIDDTERYTSYLIRSHKLDQKSVKPWISLVHKATGWMLREAGKRDTDRLVEFLKANNEELSSILRSYAVEKLTQSQKKYIKMK